MFRETGAMLEGHFLLSSGLHSSRYLQCALVLQFPAYAEQLGMALAEKLIQSEAHFDFIISPALGGIVIAQEVAKAMGHKLHKAIRALFTEREGEKMALRRGFHIENGERGIVVEDVITTGGSTKETIQVVEARGGIVKGIASIVNRGASTSDSGTPLTSLVSLRFDNYAPSECPLCQQNIPILKPGSRR